MASRSPGEGDFVLAQAGQLQRVRKGGRSVKHKWVEVVWGGEGGQIRLGKGWDWLWQCRLDSNPIHGLTNIILAAQICIYDIVSTDASSTMRWLACYTG